MVATLQSVRIARGFTRVQFLKTFRAITGQEVKLRTLRSWECKQSAVPVWVVDGYRAVLNLSDEEVSAVVGWAASSRVVSEKKGEEPHAPHADPVGPAEGWSWAEVAGGEGEEVGNA